MMVTSAPASVRNSADDSPTSPPPTIDDDLLTAALQDSGCGRSRWAMARSCTARPTLLNSVISLSTCAASRPLARSVRSPAILSHDPRALLHGQVQVACLGLRCGDVVDGDGRCCDEVCGDFAKVEPVRADQVEVRAGSTRRRGRTGHCPPGSPQQTTSHAAASAYEPAVADSPAATSSSTTRSTCAGRTAGNDDIVDAGAHHPHRVHMGNRLWPGTDDAERSHVGRASASVASAEIIGVRSVVSAAPSSKATGWPMRMSNNTYTPWMIG